MVQVETSPGAVIRLPDIFDLDSDDLRKVVDLNFLGTTPTKHSLPLSADQEKGNIIHIFFDWQL